MTISENITNNHLDLTDSAIGHFSSLLKNKDNQNIRIGIRDSGCSGYAYYLELSEEINTDDLEFSFDKFKILIDKKSFTFLNGTTIDYIKEGVNSNLKFINFEKSARMEFFFLCSVSSQRGLFIKASLAFIFLS